MNESEKPKKKSKKNKKLSKKKSRKKINIINSLKENYISWILIFIAILLISPNNYIKGLFTFLLMMIISYFIHLSSHVCYNIFSALHIYHHNNDNFYSHFSQILIELGFFPSLFLPLYCIYGKIFVNEWIIMFFVLFYSSIHNINYGYFNVNDVHSIHHKNPSTNIGPDVCDVLFGTKSKLNENVENTNHYIVNIIIITISIMCLKYFYYSSEKVKSILNKILFTFLISSMIITIIGSIVVYYG